MTKFSCHLLILIAFLTGTIAPACEFAWNDNYSVVEICGINGIEQRVVSNNNLPPHEKPLAAPDDCQFCFQNNHIAMDVTLALSLNNISISLISDIVARHDILYRKILSQYHTARGPPSFV